MTWMMFINIVIIQFNKGLFLFTFYHEDKNNQNFELYKYLKNIEKNTTIYQF